jgi:hypothetical protein
MEIPMANMPTADAVLVSYPAYNAWPMAAKINKSSWGSRRTVQFSSRCYFSPTMDEMVGTSSGVS